MSDSSASPNPFDKLIEDELEKSFRQEQEEEDLVAKFVETDEWKLDSSLIPRISPDSYQGFHHVTWYVANAKQSAFYFIVTFGFSLYAYRGLETKSKQVCSYVLKNGDTIFEFCSPLRSSGASDSNSSPNSKEINDFIEKHGDGVKDVAFMVHNLDEVLEVAVKNGATVIRQKRVEERPQELAYMITATVQIFGDTHHTLVEKNDKWKGFLPDYTLVTKESGFDIVEDATFFDLLPPVTFNKIDHCVQNSNWNELAQSCEYYAKAFRFHRFWSVDDGQISTQFSALNSIVMASPEDSIKMPINEPAKGICESQIEEFLQFYDGNGVQHIAILCDNIVDTVSAMKDRGTEFIKIPNAYYKNLKERMYEANFKMDEQLDDIEKLGILVDFDSNGYLLQIFTKPLVVRPTIFVEIIQRRNHNGFGAGNFKALFEALESLQSERGNLSIPADFSQ